MIIGRKTLDLDLKPSINRFLKPSRYKFNYGGRGSGKSYDAAFALIIKGSEEKKIICCGREILSSIKDSSKQLIEDCIEHMGLKDTFYKFVKDEIRGKNGTKFIFKGLNDRSENNIKGVHGIDFLWVDESNTIKQTTIDKVLPSIRSTARNSSPEIWFTWNPENDYDPIDNFSRGEDGPPPNSLIWQTNYYDNPFFPSELNDLMEWQKKTDYEKYLHIWEGEYLTNSEARIFNNWHLENIDDKVPKNALELYGADFGFSNTDPTVLVKMFYWDNIIYIVDEAVRVKCPISEIPELFDRIPGSRRKKIVADCSRNDLIKHLKDDGFNIIGSKKGPNSIKDGINFLQDRKIIVHPKCKYSKSELNMHSFKVVNGKVTNEIVDKHNHVIDSIRYAFETIRRSSGRKIASTPPTMAG